MLWDTRKAVFNSLLEFSPALRARHHIVKLASGKWTRTLGPPGDTEKYRVVNVKGREWKQVPRTVTEDREWWQEPTHHHATMKKSPAQRAYQYRAIVVGKGLLIGGTKRHVSSWFKTKKEADDWAWAIKEGNDAAGRPIAFVTIERRHDNVIEMIKWAHAGEVGI